MKFSQNCKEREKERMKRQKQRWMAYSGGLSSMNSTSCSNSSTSMSLTIMYIHSKEGRKRIKNGTIKNNIRVRKTLKQRIMQLWERV